jgi:hypothetical protein
MNKGMVAALLASSFMPEAAAVSAMMGRQGRKARVGEFVSKEENGNRVDQSERINFNRSKYIPGNGPDHRLGADNPECLKRGR